jgi:hypothetical protein
VICARREEGTEAHGDGERWRSRRRARAVAAAGPARDGGHRGTIRRRRHVSTWRCALRRYAWPGGRRGTWSAHARQVPDRGRIADTRRIRMTASCAVRVVPSRCGCTAAPHGDVYIKDRRYARRPLSRSDGRTSGSGVCLDACEQHHALTTRWWMARGRARPRRFRGGVSESGVRLPRSWLKRELWRAVPRAGFWPPRSKSDALAADAPDVPAPDRAVTA